VRYAIESKVLNSAPSVSIFCEAKTIILQSCDVEDASEDTIVMATEENSLISSTYCTASNSHMTYCRHQTGMPEITMHYFSRDKTFPQKWIRFGRIHRDFFPVKKPALCRKHFDVKVILICSSPNSVKERGGFLF